MDTIWLYLVSLLVVPATTIPSTQVITYDNKKMLDYIENLNGTVPEQLFLVTVTWGKLRVDYARDVAKIEELAETLDRFMCRKERNITMRDHLREHLIRDQIREHLEFLNTTSLFHQALGAEDHELGKWQLAVGRHSQKLHCLYKPHQLKSIMEKVLRKLYTLEKSGELAAFFYQLYLSGNRDSYKLMVQTELMLYERYRNGGITNRDFSSYLAKLWQSLQMDEFYVGLDQTTKQKLIDAVIELLGYL
ncbi:hypothetical protein KR018_002215 [Drosophila ironensis]|nr:hypothetical protein KR018_002215 [Drosophila ironensis]